MKLLHKIAAAVILCATCTAMSAQDVNPNDVFKKNKYLNLGYATAETCTDFSSVQKSQYSFFINKGTTYYWPKSKAWFGMLKVGLDMRWMDFSFSKYKNESKGWEDWGTPEESTGSDFLDKFTNLGEFSLTAGVFGFGPSVGVAPFASMNNGLRHLRASIYFHYQPAVSAYFISEDGETEFSWAYTGMWDFGGKLVYRALYLGIEGRWGNGKFKPLNFDSFLGEGEGSGSDYKINRKFAQTRFFIGFTF